MHGRVGPWAVADASSELGMPGTGEREVTRRVRRPSFADAIIPLVILAVLIAGSLLLVGLGAPDGPIQLALILCVLTAALIAPKNGHSWEEIEHAAQDWLASAAANPSRRAPFPTAPSPSRESRND